MHLALVPLARQPCALRMPSALAIDLGVFGEPVKRMVARAGRFAIPADCKLAREIVRSEHFPVH